MNYPYLEAKPVSMEALSLVGEIETLGVQPVHCKLYWQEDDDQSYSVELTSDEATAGTEIIGKGDGYTIQVHRESAVAGNPVPYGRVDLIRSFASSYASIQLGNLTDSSCADSRDWYDSPQGFGGPAYGLSTSNTFMAWLLGKICPQKVPDAPVGAVGWGHKPTWPGPKGG